MSIRVSKPSFSIREKLSELERPIGLKGSELMGAETAQEAGALLGVGRKNLIINGDMRVAQRGTSAVSTNAQYPVDRWVLSNTDSADIQIQQSTDVPVGEGFRNSLKWSVNSTSNTTGSQSIRQHTEVQNSKDLLGWGSSTGKYATLSFWVKGSHNGTITASVREGINASVSFINLTEVTTSWKKHSFTIPHTPNGNWSSNATSTGVTVIFAFDRHSTANGSTENKWVTSNWINHSNQTEWITISGAEIYITGVQLEVGKNATEFEHRSYGEELALCQRYYAVLGTTSQPSPCPVFSRAAATKVMGIDLPVPMRATPTAGTAGTVRILRGGSYVESNSSMVINSVTPTIYLGGSMTRLSIWWNSNLTSVTNTANDVYGGFSSGIAFSAEL